MLTSPITNLWDDPGQTFLSFQHVPICEDSDFHNEMFVKMPKHHHGASSEKNDKENSGG